MQNSIIRELQRELLDETASLSVILRKARLAARKLDLRDFENWICKESGGYDGPLNELPEYRKVPVAPRYFNLYRGWCPIFIENDLLQELCHTAPLWQPIEAIEAMTNSESGIAWLCYGHDLTKILRDSIGHRFEIRGALSVTSLLGTINAVRNTILDWAVDLEKAGILGEGLGFSSRDRVEAASVTQHIYAQNIGTFGNVDRNASVTNLQVGGDYNSETLASCVEKIRTSLPALPEQERIAVRVELEKIEQTGSNQPVAQQALRSIKTICEGAAGNLAASGVAAFLRTIVG